MPAASTDVAWPVGDWGVRVGWDADPPPPRAQYHTIHVPYEPLTTPRIRLDDEGIRYPDAVDLQPRLVVGGAPAGAGHPMGSAVGSDAAHRLTSGPAPRSTGVAPDYAREVAGGARRPRGEAP